MLNLEGKSEDYKQGVIDALNVDKKDGPFLIKRHTPMRDAPPLFYEEIGKAIRAMHPGDTLFIPFLNKPVMDK